MRIEPTTVEYVVTPLPREAWWYIALCLCLISVLVGTLSSQAIWFDPERLAPIEKYATDNKDSAVFALARSRAADRYSADILVFGSSATRESLWDESKLSQNGVGRFVKMTTSGQTPLESLFLMAQQKLRPGQLVLLGIGVSQLASDDAGRRLANGVFLQNPAAFFDAYPQAHPRNPSWPVRQRELIVGARNLFIRYLHVALPRQLRERIYQTPPLAPLESYNTIRVSPNGWMKQRRSLREAIEVNGDENLRELAAVIKAAADICARQGATLILVESPHLDTDLATTFRPSWHRYSRVVQDAAAIHKVQYLNMGDDVRLVDQDFVDAVHVSETAREAWSSRLIQNLNK